MEVTGYEKNVFVFPRRLEDTLVFSEAPEINQICGVCLISCIESPSMARPRSCGTQ